MNKTELARSLGISRQMVYKLINRGMPTDSVESATEWRRQNLDITQTKGWRIDGNKGVNHSDDLDSDLNNEDLESGLTHAETLADTVPDIWFNQIGLLGSVLKSHDIKITAEQLIKVQATLLLTYRKAVAEHLGKDVDDIIFYVPPVFRARPGNKIHLSLIKRLNQILEAEPTR